MTRYGLSLFIYRIFAVVTLSLTIFAAHAMEASAALPATVQYHLDKDAFKSSVTLWYPDGAKYIAPPTTIEIGSNALFQGEKAVASQTVKAGLHPLVILLHGGLRSADNSGAWLSSALATKGFIVAEINPPRAMSPKDAVNFIWQRPQLAQTVLTALLADNKWRKHIDSTKIHFVGFAFGATTGLMLAGSAINRSAYQHLCDGNTAKKIDCQWFKSHQITLNEANQTKLLESYLDKRIHSVVAIAPEYLGVLSAKANQTYLKALVITLGKKQITMTQPNSTQLNIPQASLFDGFNRCKMSKKKIPALQKLCPDSMAQRMLIHQQIISAITQFLSH
ncbi:alpha/beta hydrolase family protein [Celerinatantimonas sp. MCCC 1A17872]|uniref:alpha/beta hydrolase family protein n=1 Tax=Celerinatantimonas sp. MCCC 1A17872 TaxID=3177514 RepID=UPI0038BFE073